MSVEIKMIVGLGNPGPQYEKTRHNIGFAALDTLQARYKLGSWHNKFQGAYLKGDIAGKAMICLKPETYMNLSGRSVGECMRFFKLAPENILVIHDDLDLALGRLKYKQGGGHAGHNGLRSIDDLLGTQNYHRLRIGIGREQANRDTSDYVLGRFSAHEQGFMDAVLESIANNIGLLFNGHSDRFIETAKPNMTDYVEFARK